MRVLVTGAGGLLGGRIAEILHTSGLDVVAAHRRAPPPSGPEPVPVELTADGAVEGLLERVRPDAVVHAAALGRADRCEADPALAEGVNTRLPGRIAAACRARVIRLVALSTDLVLDGSRSFSDEQTRARPLGVYGRTKRGGEEAMLAACPSAAVVRVALVVGRGHGPRGTASESVAWALAAARPQRLFEDEYRTPVDAESVTGALRRLLDREGSGLYHLGGRERLSRLELGRRVAAALGLPTDGLVPVLQSEYAGPDPRPADTSLDSSRALRELGWTPRSLDEAVRSGRSRPEAAG